MKKQNYELLIKAEDSDRLQMQFEQAREELAHYQGLKKQLQFKFDSMTIQLNSLCDQLEDRNLGDLRTRIRNIVSQ